MNRESVDAYLRDGCGRCEHYRTPACKVHLWTEALVALRQVVLEAGLEETMKWGSPCYTLGGKNVAMVVAQKDFSAQCQLPADEFYADSFTSEADLANAVA